MKSPSCFAFIFTTVVLLFTVHSIQAQDYEWAITLNQHPRSFPVAIRQDNNKNIYLATFTDSTGGHIATRVEKRNANRQLRWQINITGPAAITDVEINNHNHAVVTGYFRESITIEGNILTGIPADNTGFIFETDEAGSLLWIHVLNPLYERFEPVDLFIAAGDIMYLSAENGGSGAFCSFHKLDSAGNIIKSEFPQSFENRTFSHIIADTSGNVYLSGTCGNFAMFDDIPANPDYSYQNILVKYDSSFTAQWLLSRNYITFDDNNKLCTDGKNLYWVYDDFTNNADTVVIQKVNYDSTVLSTIITPFSQLFFPAVDYSIDKTGNSIFMVQAGIQKLIYRYDPSFNIIWQDTINSQGSGFPLRNSLACYDSCFYMLGYYMSPTLTLDPFTIVNPNIGENYRSDVFACKWSNSLLTTYTFTGNGNWSDEANWLDHNVPPAVLPGGSVIYISPAPGNTCILDILQTISPGAALIITSGSSFVDTGNLTINGL